MPANSSCPQYVTVVKICSEERISQTYTTLARKMAEAKIAVEDTGGAVQLASRVAVPVEDVRPRKALNTAVAGSLGLTVGMLGAFAME